MSIVADNEITQFLEKIIKLYYKQIPDLNYFRETYNFIVEKNLVSIKSFECGKIVESRLIILRRGFQKFNLDKMYFENLPIHLMIYLTSLIKFSNSILIKK